MHYKKGVTCVPNGQLYYILCCNKMHTKTPISKFNRLCNEFTSVWSMFPSNIQVLIMIYLIYNFTIPKIFYD